MLLVALSAWVACANVFAESLPRLYEAPVTAKLRTGTIDIGGSPLIDRAITGITLPLRPAGANHNFDNVRLVGGVDTAAVDAGSAAVAGLTWAAGGPDGFGADFGVLRSGLPEVAGGGLLTQASLRVPFSFLQDSSGLSLALGSYGGDADEDDGAAGRLSFATNTPAGHYAVTYARAQQGFHPPGSQLAANQSNLQLSADYTLGRYRLRQRLRFRQARPSHSEAAHTWRSDSSWGGPVSGFLLPITKFDLNVSVWSRRGAGSHPDHTGWLLKARGQGIRWGAWHFDTRLSWGRKATATPVGHAGWQWAGTLPIQLGSCTGSLSTHLGLKLRSVAQTDIRLRSGVGLKMHYDAQQLSLDADWISGGRHDNASTEQSLRVMFNYSIATARALSPLAALVGSLMSGL